MSSRGLTFGAHCTPVSRADVLEHCLYQTQGVPNNGLIVVEQTLAGEQVIQAERQPNKYQEIQGKPMQK